MGPRQQKPQRSFSSRRWHANATSLKSMCCSSALDRPASVAPSGSHSFTPSTTQRSRPAPSAGPQLSAENILVIDKARNVGDHGISGAVLDPRSLTELFGDFLAAGCPVEGPVTSDQLWFMTRAEHIKAPLLPPPMVNHGKYVASLNKLVKWLAEPGRGAWRSGLRGDARARAALRGRSRDRRAHGRQGRRQERRSKTQLRTRTRICSLR